MPFSSGGISTQAGRKWSSDIFDIFLASILSKTLASWLQVTPMLNTILERRKYVGTERPVSTRQSISREIPAHRATTYCLSRRALRIWRSAFGKMLLLCSA